VDCKTNRERRLREIKALMGSVRTRAIPVAMSIAMFSWAAPVYAMDVIAATPYWSGGVGKYETRQEAFVGQVEYWCGLPENKTYFTSCSPGVLGEDNWGTVVTNYGTYRLFIIQQHYSCPANYQMFAFWTDANGITHKPACVNWSAPPPPPPPPPKVVALDPGHGFTCPSRGMKLGTEGVTSFPVSNPPVGRLKEDNLTVAFALEAEKALGPKFRVVLTKRTVDACPSFLERGRIANNANAKIFVSIHANAPALAIVPHGTSTFYNRDKASFNLAFSLSERVAQALGLNNRGPQVDEEIAVLKPTVTNMDAVLLEAGRLSGRDEEILHSGEAPKRVAEGIRAAVTETIGGQ
jgi:N-acetylmuramoyl-L-alanine amidase